MLSAVSSRLFPGLPCIGIYSWLVVLPPRLCVMIICPLSGFVTSSYTISASVVGTCTGFAFLVASPFWVIFLGGSISITWVRDGLVEISGCDIVMLLLLYMSVFSLYMFHPLL